MKSIYVTQYIRTPAILLVSNNKNRLDKTITMRSQPDVVVSFVYALKTLSCIHEDDDDEEHWSLNKLMKKRVQYDLMGLQCLFSLYLHTHTYTHNVCNIEIWGAIHTIFFNAGRNEGKLTNWHTQTIYELDEKFAEMWNFCRTKNIASTFWRNTSQPCLHS